ncbi:uncharacterized protein SRS1_14944 [Sporisorium reilianum f. sp. reilianum]|uniref:RxLR effector protein n=1 Tax=Sporisorium reilianum f. sp. reilianum TaxID=72559 RepID=A0A2N8UH63_9BASI|nr:uncharacterized protein SRS1_14944 [Sporisorium reilianum f. sp. reilianum]
MRLSASFVVALMLFTLSSNVVAHSAMKKSRRMDASSSESEVLNPPVKPKPLWWKSYSRFAYEGVPVVFNGNIVNVEKLEMFKARLESLHHTRSHVLKLRKFLTLDEVTDLSKPLNLDYWRKFKGTEENPHALSLAGIYYQQDQSNILAMDLVLKRLAEYL